MTWTSYTEAMQLNDLERQVYCKQFLETLEPRLQFVALRRYYQNQSLAAIAEELGVSYSRAYQLELRIRTKLCRHLRKDHL